MSKLDKTYQAKWSGNTLYSRAVLSDVGKGVQLHSELDHVLSSAAACLNVLGNLGNDGSNLARYLNRFGLEIDQIVPFPTNCTIGGETYDDKGLVVFEWIGPGKSTLNERGGKRGQNRTSIDAYVLGRIGGRLTQVLIEWKFSETYLAEAQHQRFAGVRGTERARRYSLVLAKLRKAKAFPFSMADEGGWGLHDMGYEPLYQLLRMTLLAKTTTPLQLSADLEVLDYRILHLTHSENHNLNIVSDRQLRFNAGLVHKAGASLHDLWRGLLAPEDARRFISGHWNLHLDTISDPDLRTYLMDRYA